MSDRTDERKAPRQGQTRERIMSTTIDRLTPSVNGTHRKPKPQRKPAKAPGIVSVTRSRRPLTIGLGCGIPLLSLTLSHQGGELLAADHYALGCGSLALCAVVLALSLSHLASAIEDITHSSRWQAWALAIATDSALVTAELVRVSGQGGAVQWAMLAVLTMASACLNCWAFFRHGR